MKRFILDMGLVLVLIWFSIYLWNQDHPQMAYTAKIIHDNQASKLALQCSEICIAGLRLFFDLFYILFTRWIG